MGLLALFLLAAASASAAAPVRLALIEDEPTTMTQMLTQPLERVLRESGAGASLTAVEEVSCVFAGSDHRFRLPSGLGAPDTTASSDAVALETDAEVAFVYPPDPELIAALKKAAADPATYRRPASMRLIERAAEVSAARNASGETLLTLQASLERPATRRWRTALAAYYRLDWKGRDTAVLLLGRTYGGIGRMAAAAARAAEDGPLTGLARGGTFGSAVSDARGRVVAEALERAGLKYSAVSASELGHWSELETYRRERPDGVVYLSANLVYSTAPAQTALPPFAVFTASGTRFAVVGLTPEWTARLLARPELPRLSLKDPVTAASALIPRLRAEADAVIVLSALPPEDNARLAHSSRGIDLILADNAPFLVFTPPPSSLVEQDDRPVFANPMTPVRTYSPALNVIEVDRREDGERADWKVRSSAMLLDDGVNPAEDYPEPAVESFAAGRSTQTPLLPAAREVFPPSERAGLPIYESRDFWTLAAGLLTQRGRAEAGLLAAPPLSLGTVGAVRESFVRHWLGDADGAVLVSVGGAELKRLAEDAAEQKRREEAGLPHGGRLRMVVSGLDSSGLLRGAPLDPHGTYRLATSRAAADALALPGDRDPLPGAASVADAVLAELRALPASTPPARWRGWMLGRPIVETGLWKVDFRDVGLNVRQTRVTRSDAFDPVPNSRVQGYDELLVGGVLKTDVEYTKRDFKWGNTLELEYAKSRLQPRHAPATTNLASNRIMFLTLGTRRAGRVPYGWLARSWGPSLGLQYDGEFQAAPGLRRKQVYSVFPGVEFFDGTVVRSLELSGNIKRDLSRDPPNTQTGLRLRSLVSTPLGPGGAELQGELWNNYFFLTKHDTAADLRMEGDANVKLRIPVRRHLSVAPFVDFSWFQLKTKPDWGYSLMTGIAIGFSRLWKPQYEPF